MVKKVTLRVFFWIVVSGLMIYYLSPLLFLISTSLKTYKDAFAMPPKIIFTPIWDNYQHVMGARNFPVNIRNSVICATVPTLISLTLGIPCAYALAMFDRTANKRISTYILGIRIIPPIMLLLPMYVIFNNIRLIGTFTAMFIMYVMFTLPLIIWIMPVYFREIPGEIREAAIIDGCSEAQVFLRIMLPLTKASIAAAAILSVVQCWNEFLMASIITTAKTQTLPVVISSFLGFNGLEWGNISAAAVIVMAPMILFGFFVQKYFAKGMVAGAVKG